MTNVKGIKAEKQNGKLKEYFSSLFRDSMDNYVHRRSRRLDTRLLLLVSALLVVGLFSLASSSYVYAYYHTDNHNSSYYIVQQLIYAAIGAAGMLAASYVPVKYYKQGLKWLYIITIIMLALCYVCKAKNGCHRWLWLGKGPSFQPSELAKFTVIALGAYWGSELYTKKKPYLKNIRKRPKPSRKLSAPDRFFFRIGSFLCNTWELLRNSIFFYLGLVMVIALLIVFETHLSCTIIIMLIALTITFLAGMPWVPLLATMVTAGGAAIALITSGIAAYSSSAGRGMADYAEPLRHFQRRYFRQGNFQFHTEISVRLRAAERLYLRNCVRGGRHGGSHTDNNAVYGVCLQGVYRFGKIARPLFQAARSGHCLADSVADPAQHRRRYQFHAEYRHKPPVFQLGRHLACNASA